MKKNVLTVILASMMMLSMGVLACSTTDQSTGEVETVGQSDIPLYDRAIPDDGTLEETRQNMYDAEAASLQDMNVEITAYTTDATLDEVVSWYDEALTDWTRYEGLEQGNVTVTRWGQGNNTVFAIFYMPDPEGGDANRLFMEYVWK